VSAEVDLVVRRFCKSRKETVWIMLRRLVYDAPVIKERPYRAANVRVYIAFGE
jgi:hypothetical protein